MPSIYKHILSFDGDAFRIFLNFKDQPHAFFLDSSLIVSSEQFSYIGFDPLETFSSGGLVGLKKNFDKYRLKSKSLLFPAGAVGYLGYDGSIFFGFYDTILAVDHHHKKLIISSFSKVRLKGILKRLAEMGHGDELFLSTKKSIYKGHLDFKSNFTKLQYMKAVRQALAHIKVGNIYQINLSHQMKLDLPHWRQYAEPADIYNNLRQSSPSQFGAYFDDGKQVILSASPERFLKLQDGIAQVKPMKGTRPRGKTVAQDRQLKEQLLQSPKEIAELLMVTDLERNDLGRVCDYASINVKSMRTIEEYSSVFQATSTVEGRLRRCRNQFDLLEATFPSGSVTGCPKIEAMKIIKKL